MKNKLYLLLVIILQALVSCDVEKLMDKQDTDPNTAKKIFQDKAKIRQVLTNLYGNAWFSASFGGFNVFSKDISILENATEHSVGTNKFDASVSFAQSSLNAANPPFPGSVNPWTQYYEAIRSANLFITNADDSVLTDDEKVIMKEEARLLRAIYYHELFRFYGAVVLIGDRIVDGMDTSLERSELSETIDYIISEFDAIINNAILPESVWPENVDYGRVTLGMAYAYKARTLLYVASPLNSPENSIEKWARAAEAAKMLISKGWYSLHVDENEPLLSFARYFNNRTSPEQIFSVLRGPTQDMYRNLPPGAPWNRVVTWPGTAITMNAVDAFAMKDGKPAITGYDSNGKPEINPDSGYNDEKPFENRDPRLDMTVMRHGSQWRVNGMMITMDVNTQVAGTVLGITNICIRKFLDDRIDHWNGATTHINYPLMRYAEVLLNYVEAKNESLSSLDAANMVEIIDYINLIRDRAGAYPLPATGWTKETLRDQIKMERRMELMLEGHRFYDVRRWKDAYKYFNGEVYGMDVVNNKIVRRFVRKQVFYDKFYRLPVPSRDVNGSKGKIWQNPGW